MPARIDVESKARNKLDFEIDDAWGLKEILTYLYHEKKLSTVEISNKLKVGRSVVTSRLREYDIVIRSPKRGNEIKKPRTYPKGLFNNITHEIAYFLGLFLADGYFADSRKAKLCLAENDHQILRKISKYIFDEDYVVIKKNPTHNEQDKAKLILYNKDYCQEIGNILNISPNYPKTGKEQFIYFRPEALIWSFIRGFFDGDGGISIYERDNRKKVHLTFTSASRTFLYNLRDFFEDHHINFAPESLRKKKNENCYSLGSSSIKTVKKIGSKIYRRQAVFKIKRKFNKFQELLSD